MSLKKLLHDTSKNIYSSHLMFLLRECKINQEQFKFFTIQRISIAYNFESLLISCLEEANNIGDRELELALRRNLADEYGEDAEGNVNPQMAHKHWRENYLSALNIHAESVDLASLLPETIMHSNTMLDLAKRNDVFLIAGALLASEIIIPIEYRNVRASRDYLFPEKFVTQSSDSVETKEAKFQASLYINDHIIHDAKSHYPELLNALIKYENDEDKMLRITQGINLIKAARETFYDGVEKEWSILDYSASTRSTDLMNNNIL